MASVSALLKRPRCFPRVDIGRRAMLSTTASRRNDAATPPPLGVARALQDTSSTPPPTLFSSEFSLADRVALVTGANRGLGLEGALALAEAGARAVYCVDVADAPSETFRAAQAFAARLRGPDAESPLQYVQGDVGDQEQMWRIGRMIGDREGRMDACVACAGIAPESQKSMYIPDDGLQKASVLDVNLKGALYTAQAAGQQMERFGNGGSITLIASVAGHLSVDMGMTPYEMSKGGVLQLARSLACELAPERIRVNTISPGYFRTPMVDILYRENPEWAQRLANRSASKRTAEPYEVRGLVVWLASSASSFCTGSDITIDGGYRAC
ncbi:NAD-P-binding protein [Lenzites betulinus]|nr:NAD-P-binding protein [Lenzites betulinus]